MRWEEQKSAERLVAERLALEEWRKTDECHGLQLMEQIHFMAERLLELAGMMQRGYRPTGEEIEFFGKLPVLLDRVRRGEFKGEVEPLGYPWTEAHFRR